MLEQLKQAVGRGTPSQRASTGAFHECRQCGTTVDDDADGCPACGSTEIARYDL
ncbi:MULTISPECIES: hypothetical protein [Haloarcula]|uniref:hypothetical protein n=1 Tax=Haloarcula TaxID=2237 RepID=UPI00140EC343|nr:hypothetical protein [Halomicroarcula pellucida]MBX0348921.1 hypothetical protein [Halomicroarcula pellucida]QIO20842.1 hypothetical protein G9465_01210 [Haloarcula sp. JP-L23]